MPFTSSQQARIDAAQQRNDAAKAQWLKWVSYWNVMFVNMACYKDTKHPVEAAATWFTPNDSSCSSGKGCTSDDKQNCKANIKDILNNIGSLRNAYIEFNAAQKNYDKVFAEVTEEAKNDPAFITQQNQIAANANAQKLKWVFGIVVVVVISFGVYAYFKWFRK